MKESILHNKSIDFAADIVNFYEDFFYLILLFFILHDSLIHCPIDKRPLLSYT